MREELTAITSSLGRVLICVKILMCSDVIRFECRLPFSNTTTQARLLPPRVKRNDAPTKTKSVLFTPKRVSARLFYKR